MIRWSSNGWACAQSFTQRRVVPGGRSSLCRRTWGVQEQDPGWPWPAFPADLTSIAVALATQAEGSILVHEWMFENRLIFTDKLILMVPTSSCATRTGDSDRPRRLRASASSRPTYARPWRCCLPPCGGGRSEIGNIRRSTVL